MYGAEIANWVRFAFSRSGCTFVHISEHSRTSGLFLLLTNPRDCSGRKAPCATPRGVAQRSPRILPSDELGSFRTTRESVAPGCMGLHQVAPRRTDAPLHLSKSPRATHFDARLLTHPDRARIASETRTTARVFPENRARKFRIVVSAFARSAGSGSASPTDDRVTPQRARTAPSRRPCGRSRLRPSVPARTCGRVPRTWPCRRVAVPRSSSPTASGACRSRSPGGR
jgi:hypothetical protein